MILLLHDILIPGLFEHEIKKIAMQFSENEGRVKGRLKLFRKFIRFGVATCPLVLYYISMTSTLIPLRLFLNALMSAFGSIDGPINLG